MNFGENLKRIRKDRGITQEELKNALGLKTRTMIHYYENDISQPSLDTSIAIADYLGVSLDELTGGSDSNFPFAKNLENDFELNSEEKVAIANYADFLISKRKKTDLSIKAVYQADNGDLFFEHNNSSCNRNREDIKNLIEVKLPKFMDSNKAIECKAIVTEQAPGIELISYAVDDSIFATAGINITNNFYYLQNFIYITRISIPSQVEQIIDAGRGSYAV